MGMNVKITGNNTVDGRPLEASIDPSGSIVTVAHAHNKIHGGTYYTANHYETDVAAGGDVEVLLHVGSDVTAHSIFKVAAGADAEIQIFEDPTVTNEGTSLSVINHNRTTPGSGSSTAFHTPTTSADGTELLHELIPGGRSGAGAVGGLAVLGTVQYVLNTDTYYLVRVTNRGAGAEDISIIVAFYEVPV